MASAPIATVIKMLESLPEAVQDQVVEHLREYLAEVQDELEWDESFKQTQHQLKVAARRARREVAEGHSEPLDHDRL